MLHMQTVSLTGSLDRASVVRVARQAGIYGRRERQHIEGDLLARRDKNCDAAVFGPERRDAATVSRDDE